MMTGYYGAMFTRQKFLKPLAEYLPREAPDLTPEQLARAASDFDDLVARSAKDLETRKPN